MYDNVFYMSNGDDGSAHDSRTVMLPGSPKMRATTTCSAMVSLSGVSRSTVSTHQTVLSIGQSGPVRGAARIGRSTAKGRSAQPVPATGTNPAADTRFRSSNTADPAVNVYDDCTENAFQNSGQTRLQRP
jgi:hypothetical protein